MKLHQVLLALLVIAADAPGMLGQRVTPPDAPPARKTSYELIDEALAAKRINAETAHKYRVFAAFADTRLPKEYQGANVSFELPRQVQDVESLLDSFSDATKAELAPFFMRPEEPGSWITLPTVGQQPPSPGGTRPNYSAGFSGASFRAPSSMHFAAFDAASLAHFNRSVAVSSDSRAPSGWQTFSAANGKAKVWAQDRYPGDAAKAQVLANELTRIIWDKLVNLMGPEPLSDANSAHNGGDGAFDFYLIHAPMATNPATGNRARSFLGTMWNPPDVRPCAAGYILLDSNEPIGSPTTPGILSIAAHEFMHAVTRALRPRDNGGCGEHWIQEASATWAENYVYPQANAEHIWPNTYLDRPRWPLDSENGEHAYGAYLLPYFMEMKGPDGAQFLRAIWEQMRTKPALQAINDAMSGGWDKWWPLFLNTNWNQPPLDRPDGYRGWDDITPRAFGWHLDFDVGTTPRIQPLTFDYGNDAGPPGLPYLSGAYFAFSMRPSVRSVFFENTVAELGQPHSSVWGIQKIRGSWQKPEDWTKDLEKAWCRDNRKEDLEELIVVFGNSDWKTKKTLKPPTDPEVKAYPTGCTAWTGTTVVTTTIEIPDHASTITEIVRSSSRFVVDSTFNEPGEPRRYWKVVSGSLAWEVKVTGRCSGGKQDNRAIQDRGEGNEEARLSIWEDGGKMVAQVNDGPWPGDVPTYTINCPNDPPATLMFLSSGVGIGPGLGKQELAPGAKSFGGDYTTTMSSSSGMKRRYQYSFKVAP